MKVTVENNIKDYSIDYIKEIRIGFSDNTEVKLCQIADYDFDLEPDSVSLIKLTCILNNSEMENQLSKHNKIFYVHVKICGCDPYEGRRIDVDYDIPCDMKIKKLRIEKSDEDDFNDMYIELDGYIK